MTSAEIAAMPFFKAACSKLGVEPNKRQVRKCRQGAGRWAGHPLVMTLRNVNQERKEAA